MLNYISTNSKVLFGVIRRARENGDGSSSPLCDPVPLEVAYVPFHVTSHFGDAPAEQMGQIFGLRGKFSASGCVGSVFKSFSV